MPDWSTQHTYPWSNGTYVFRVVGRGTGFGKVYDVINEYYDGSGNLINSNTQLYPLVPYIGPSIDKNTVTVTTPIDITAVQLSPYEDVGISGRDGLAGLCANCTKLTSFDFTTDVVTPTNGMSKGNYAPYVFLNCESLVNVNIGDFWSDSDGNFTGASDPQEYYQDAVNNAANKSLCCFMGCKNLETITGVFNFADDPNSLQYKHTIPPITTPGWSLLQRDAEYMFYGCDKLTNVQIHLTGDSNSFINDRVYETLGLKRNQFVLV